MKPVNAETGSRVKGVILLLFGSALIAFSVSCVMSAYDGLSNLWADYQDSPASTYFLFGGIFLVIALVSGALGIRFFTWGYRRIR